jgi:hypothetical protein
VVRPGRAPCGARTALSWDHGALRGDDPLAATDMGSVGPLGVSTPSGLPRDGRAERIAPRGALRAPSDSLQRSIAAPPHRPGPPKETSADDASSPGLSCPTTRARTSVRLLGASSPEASRARFGYLLRDHDRRTCGWSFDPPSVLGLHPSRPSPRAGRTPSREPLPSCRCPRLVASPLKERADAVGFRASIPAASSFCRRALASTTRRCLPGLHPSRAFSPTVLASAYLFAPAPSSRVGRERRPDPPASRGLPERQGRLTPLGAAGSPGILHLATVAAS